ncbi:Rhs-family protein, partial [hydrothermal vent metagenome]
YDNENRFNIVRDALDNYQGVRYFLGRPTEFQDKDNALWKRDYTLNGRLRSMTDPMGRVTHYEHHDNGLLKAVTDPEGRNTRYHWNTRGELIQVTDFEGNQQRLKYNDFGQVIERHVILKPSEDYTAEPSITQYAYTLTGQLKKVIASNGDTTDYQFNENDQLIRHSDPQGRITRFEYDGLSQVVKRINANGYALIYKYDKERNLIGLTNENGDHYRFEYDGCERLVKETGFDGRVQQYTYNKAGHLIQHQDGTVITDYERDVIGQMVTKTCRDTENKQAEERSRYQYDAKGRIIETYNRHQWLEFEFDQLGNLIKERHGDIGDKNQIIHASRVEIAYAIQWPN